MFSLKILLCCLLFMGLLSISVHLTKESIKIPEQKIVYKYIPRSFTEEQRNPVYATDIFRTMFTLPSVWIRSIGDLDQRKHDEIQDYFISQV